MLPGIAKTSLFCSNALRAVIKDPLFSGDSITKTPKLSPEIILFLCGKFCAFGLVSIGNSLIKAPLSVILSANCLLITG